MCVRNQIIYLVEFELYNPCAEQVLLRPDLCLIWLLDDDGENFGEIVDQAGEEIFLNESQSDFFKTFGALRVVMGCFLIFLFEEELVSINTFHVRLLARLAILKGLFDVSFLQVLFPSISIFILKKRVFDLLSLTNQKNIFAKQVKAGVSDSNLIKVSGIHDFLSDIGQHCQVCWIDEDNVELSNHEGNRTLLWVVFQLFLLSFNIIDHIELLLREIFDLLLVFTSDSVLPGRELEFCKAKLQLMLPSES